MMPQSNIELKEVKSIIRGLIISSTVTTTLRQLEIDYRKQEGITIPFRTFGYPSAEAFLQSIPDTVRLREPSRGCPTSLLIVEPVQSEKSEHVEKMVTKQRNSKPLRGMKRCSAVPESQTPRRAGRESSGLNGMAPRFIPLALRTSLSRVCQRYAPHGLPLSSLGVELSRDLSMAGWAEGGKCGWLNTNGFSSIEEVIDGLKDQGLIKFTTRNGQDWVISNNASENRHKTSEEMESIRHEMNSQRIPGSEIVPAGSEMSDDEWPNDESEVIVSDRMKKNFRDILTKHPKGLWCADLPLEYKKHTGSELDVKQIGFISIVQMASRLKDVFICTRPHTNSDWLLFDSQSNSLWNCPAAPIGKGNQMPSLPSKFIRNVECLLMDHSNGIERAKFLEAYKVKFKEDFPLIDFGFENVMALLGHLAKRKIVHLKFSGYIPMVCRPCSYSLQENLFGGLKKDGDFINALYPKEVVGRNVVIPIQPLPEDLVPGCSFDVQVTEVLSPSKFWFQIWDNDLKAEFDLMMDEMQVFYNSDGPMVHKLPDAVIMIGQYCAARFPPLPNPVSEWHRAVITSLPSLSEAEVYYVDYGSTLKLKRTEIYFLDLRFSKLPLQALSGRLTNIRPLGYGLWKKLRNLPSSEEICSSKPAWSKSCVQFFVDLIANTPSVAAVTHIRKSDNCLSLGLTDTTGVDDKHINDMFVESKLAEFGEMTDDEDDSPSLSPLKHESEHSTSSVHYERPSPQKSPLPLLSPGGSSSPLPRQRPIMRENGYHNNSHTTTGSMSPLESSYPPGSPVPPTNGNCLGKLLGGEQSVEKYLREELLKKAMREEEEVRPRDEARRLEEARRMEEVRRLEEARILQLQGRLEDQRRLEDKVKQETYLRLEMQKLEIQQQLLDLQRQQYEAHLRLLNAQERLAQERLTQDVMHSGINSFLGSQVPLPAPPPGMTNVIPIANLQASFPQLLPGALQSNSLPSGIRNPLQNPTAFGNLPLPNQAYTQWSGFEKLPSCGFGDVGHNFASKPIVYSPPGFENFSNPVAPLQVPKAAETPSFNHINAMPNGIVCSESGSFPVIPNKLVVPKDVINTAENCSNKSPAGFANSNSLPESLDSNIIPIPGNNLKNASVPPINEESFSKTADIPNTAVNHSQNEAAVDNFVNSPENAIIHPHSIETSSLLAQSTAPKIESSKNSSAKVTPGNKNKSEFISELSTMLGSCAISSSNGCGPSNADEENTSQIHLQLEIEKSQCDDQEKWKIKIHTPNSEDESKDLMKGRVNGKMVNVIIVNGAKCVLTEEILGLFFNNLPVHVAVRIAELRPNGHKIESVTLNPLKDRTLCRKISSLNVIEINPRGSDVHLITVGSLHYLCSALGDPF